LHGPQSPIPNDILANRKRAKDRATYHGAMDHPDNTTVRSAVGLLVGVVWVMDVVNAIGVCWDGNPDRCTYPTETAKTNRFEVWIGLVW
jgi:hypothetical protein